MKSNRYKVRMQSKRCKVKYAKLQMQSKKCKVRDTK